MSVFLPLSVFFFKHWRYLSQFDFPGKKGHVLYQAVKFKAILTLSHRLFQIPACLISREPPHQSRSGRELYRGRHHRCASHQGPALGGELSVRLQGN